MRRKAGMDEWEQGGRGVDAGKYEGPIAFLSQGAPYRLWNMLFCIGFGAKVV